MLHSRNEERDLGIVKYLLEHIVAIQQYTEGYDDDLFYRDNKTKDAVLTRLMALGEYSSQLDQSLKERFSMIDWRSIKAARNYYTHVYKGIDWVLVWNVLVLEIPELKLHIEHIIEVLEKENNGKTN